MNDADGQVSLANGRASVADGENALGGVRILASLTGGELQRLTGACEIRLVAAQEEIVLHMSRGREIYFILEGRFSVRMASPIGRLVLIRELGEGGHFGEISAMTGAPRSVSVCAETEGRIAICPSASFMEVMGENAAFARDVANQLARTVVLLTDKVFELSALEVRFRIYAELIRLARSGEVTDAGVRIAQAPTHEALAAAVGAQREAVTRELRALAKDGVLRQNRREIEILDLDRLRAMVRQRGGETLSQYLDWAG